MNKQSSSDSYFDIGGTQANLFEKYEALNNSYSILDAKDGFKEALEGNRKDILEPVNRWYRLKESFSTVMLPRVCSNSGRLNVC